MEITEIKPMKIKIKISLKIKITIRNFEPIVKTDKTQEECYTGKEEEVPVARERVEQEIKEKAKSHSTVRVSDKTKADCKEKHEDFHWQPQNRPLGNTGTQRPQLRGGRDMPKGDKNFPTLRSDQLPQNGERGNSAIRRPLLKDGRDRPPPHKEAEGMRKRPQLAFLGKMRNEASQLNSCHPLRSEKGQRRPVSEEELMSRVYGLMGWGRGRRINNGMI
ncbi:uncharacterized protein LOC125712773 [Brienomyrus brachyistius]|uniref:uncharacterized protein LOC125712773 n=1 Tax=Brienomyrus brachyistius TaxID=42636 RepID=UPI0020B41EBC|nr:uncharacterized protein LOC125712773 [Brienomyrus brachyistius]